GERRATGRRADEGAGQRLLRTSGLCRHQPARPPDLRHEAQLTTPLWWKRSCDLLPSRGFIDRISAIFQRDRGGHTAPALQQRATAERRGVVLDGAGPPLREAILPPAGQRIARPAEAAAQPFPG